jgi:transcriptional repressor NrdR
VRFASVYRQFQSISDFVATLEGLGGVRASRAKAALVAAG